MWDITRNPRFIGDVYFEDFEIEDGRPVTICQSLAEFMEGERFKEYLNEEHNGEEKSLEDLLDYVIEEIDSMGSCLEEEVGMGRFTRVYVSKDFCWSIPVFEQR